MCKKALNSQMVAIVIVIAVAIVVVNVSEEDSLQKSSTCCPSRFQNNVTILLRFSLFHLLFLLRISVSSTKEKTKTPFNESLVQVLGIRKAFGIV